MLLFMVEEVLHLGVFMSYELLFICRSICSVNKLDDDKNLAWPMPVSRSACCI